MKQNVSLKTKNNNGTREWAAKTVNCCTGCSHDCIYCYGKSMALRFWQVKESQWGSEKIRQHDVIRKHPKYPGRVMFPSSHDITPNNLSACLQVLNNLLAAGNEVLIVSKPHLESIRAICQQFGDYGDRILFRFTIGAQNDRLLSLFEPNAPGYQERKAALQYAYEHVFNTSVSAEPMLDPENIDSLIADLLQFVTDALWIGKMNYLGRLYSKVSPEVQAALKIIENGQTDENIHAIYERHRNNPKIKWKKGIKKIVGLPLAPQPGMDI
jgi:DNA repair photolyase